VSEEAKESAAILVVHVGGWIFITDAVSAKELRDELVQILLPVNPIVTTPEERRRPGRLA
jgi:hypothetical protein